MSEEETILSYEQLAELVKLFYLEDNSDREEIDQQLNNWYKSQSSIPISFEIIRTSDNEPLRFFAALCLHYFIKNHINFFSEENIEDMANLFTEFILANQNRIDSADTKYIMISLADLFGIFNQLIDIALETFPPYIFLYLIGLLAEEAEEQLYRSRYNKDHHINQYINQFKDIIYQYFAETEYSSQWAQSFQRIFRFFLEPNNCIQFLDKIEIMSHDESNYSSFLKIFTDAFNLDYNDDELYYEFNTLISQIAIPFAINNPNFATLIWKTIFDFDHSFLLSQEKIDFSENVMELFIENFPALNEDEDLMIAVTKFTEILSTPFDFIVYPDDLILKHTLSFIEVLINAYNEKRSKVMEYCIESVNHFITGKFLDEIKEFIVSQPISPAIFLIYKSKIFNVSDDEQLSDNEIIIQVMDCIFELPEVPVEAFAFIKGKVVFTSLIEPYIEQFIQLCLIMLEECTADSIESLRMLSKFHKQEVSPYSYDLSVSLMPILPQLNFPDQDSLILFFFNIITPADTESLIMIRDLILQTCSSMIEAQELELFERVMNFLKKLYSDYPTSDEFIKEFMCEMLPLIFHELTPIALEHEDIIQDELCGLLLDASKSIVFPDAEDKEERQQLFLETEAYGEIFEWLFTIMNQFLCSGHLSVLAMLKIQPTPEILDVISQIEPNDHFQIINELFKYFQFICQCKSEKLWQIIPFEFVINFMNSDDFDVISSLLLFFRNLENISIEIKSIIMQEIINRSACKEWISQNKMIYEYIKTIAILVGGNEEVFDLYYELMASFFPDLENTKMDYFERLLDLSKKNKTAIENIHTAGYSNNIKDDLLNIISFALFS